MRLALVLLCVLGMSSCGKVRAEDSQLIQLIEKNWTMAYRVLPVGVVEIVQGTPLRRNGQASLGDEAAYELLREQKDIVITSDIDENNRNLEPVQLFSLKQGVKRRMVVTPTSLDDSRWRCPEFYVQSFGKGKLVCILLGSGSMEGVVRSQKFRDGTKQCWLMMGNHHWNWSALERKIRDRQGKVTDEKMKFMAIGEYDEFTKKWQLAMADYAVRSLPFEEQERFDQRLRQAVFADKQ